MLLWIGWIRRILRFIWALFIHFASNHCRAIVKERHVATLVPDVGLSCLPACTDMCGNCLINRCDKALPLPIRDHGKHYAWSFGKRVKGR